MAVRIVDLFELIDINQQQRHAVVIMHRPLEFIGCQEHKIAAVGKPRQVIGIGNFPEVFFPLDFLCYIRNTHSIPSICSRSDSSCVYRSKIMPDFK